MKHNALPAKKIFSQAAHCASFKNLVQGGPFILIFNLGLQIH